MFKLGGSVGALALTAALAAGSFRDMRHEVRKAVPSEAPVIAEMVGELLLEIMEATGTKSFRLSQPDSEDRLQNWLGDGTYRVLLAQQGATVKGFVAVTECRALYADGIFGVITELYVKPGFRSEGVGAALLAETREVARRSGWTRIEVTTPLLPQFDRTVTFYRRQGFHISGGQR